jgi:hypothetical protein
MSKSHSRRAVLAGIAAVPALAAPALALSDNGADAELIDLGRRLQAAYPKYQDAKSRFAEAANRLEAYVATAIGLPINSDEWSTEQWGRYHAAADDDRFKTPSRRRGRAYDVWSDRAEVCDDLVDRINDIPAKSLQGLGTKALAAAWSSRSPMADGPDWRDGDIEQEVVQLIDNVAELAGLSIPGEMDDPITEEEIAAAAEAQRQKDEAAS